MNIEEVQRQNRQEWVTALRSGDYKQTSGILRDENGYCCLGVACDLYDSTKWVKVVIDGGVEYEYMGDNAVLPDEIQLHYGLSYRTGSFRVNERLPSNSLIEENDDSTPFSTIADIIESEPEGLLV